MWPFAQTLKKVDKGRFTSHPLNDWAHLQTLLSKHILERTLIGWCTPIENWSTCDAWSWIWRGLVECVFALMKQPWLFLERRLLWKDMWYVKALSCVVTTKTIMIYGTISMGNVVEESFLKTTNDLKLISKRWLHGVMVWVCNILFLVN